MVNNYVLANMEDCDDLYDLLNDNTELPMHIGDGSYARPSGDFDLYGIQLFDTNGQRSTSLREVAEENPFPLRHIYV